jgi:hypothetical protein
MAISGVGLLIFLDKTRLENALSFPKSVELNSKGSYSIHSYNDENINPEYVG